MKALRVMFRLGLLFGFGIEILGLPARAQTTSPAWVPIAGTGPDGLCTKDNTELPVSQGDRAATWHAR